MKQVQTDEGKQRKQQAQVQNENIDFELADTEKVSLILTIALG